MAQIGRSLNELTQQRADAGIHIWHSCNACGARPIVGRRYDCQSCLVGPENALCEACYRGWLQGRVMHPATGNRDVPGAVGRHEFVAVDGESPETAIEWSRVPDVNWPAPIVADGFVVRPEFLVAGESFWGSYAFAVADGSGQWAAIVTALHVMDEVARHAGVDCSADNERYTGGELPAIVGPIRLYDVFAPKWILAELGEAGPMLVLPDARIGDDEPRCQRDIAAFRIGRGARVVAAPLARSVPDVGEPLWLAVNAQGGPSSRVRPAVVVHRSPDAFVFRFLEGTEGPRYPSGAPLIDTAGRVVGINVGGGFFEGRQYGHGVDADSIRRSIGAATGH